MSSLSTVGDHTLSRDARPRQIDARKSSPATADSSSPTSQNARLTGRLEGSKSGAHTIAELRRPRLVAAFGGLPDLSPLVPRRERGRYGRSARHVPRPRLPVSYTHLTLPTKRIV